MNGIARSAAANIASSEQQTSAQERVLALWKNDSLPRSANDVIRLLADRPERQSTWQSSVTQLEQKGQLRMVDIARDPVTGMGVARFVPTGLPPKDLPQATFPQLVRRMMELVRADNLDEGRPNVADWMALAEARMAVRDRKGLDESVDARSHP
jgi:hypothetical protein